METLTAWIASWAALYNDSTALETVVACAHVGGMLLAGGLAIAADRTTLRATRAHPELRTQALSELAGVHGVVVIGLIVTVGSGVLMYAADLDTMLKSWVMWLKLGLFVLLLANGLLMRRTEDALERAAPERTGPGSAIWSRLRACAVASLVLWFGVALAGTALLNVS